MRLQTRDRASLAIKYAGRVHMVTAMLRLQRAWATVRAGTRNRKRFEWTSASPDRVAIVTGGNRGIGYAISAELLAEGAHVVVANLDPARNAQAVEKLKAHRTAA